MYQIYIAEVTQKCINRFTFLDLISYNYDAIWKLSSYSWIVILSLIQHFTMPFYICLLILSSQNSSQTGRRKPNLLSSYFAGEENQTLKMVRNLPWATEFFRRSFCCQFLDPLPLPQLLPLPASALTKLRVKYKRSEKVSCSYSHYYCLLDPVLGHMIGNPLVSCPSGLHLCIEMSQDGNGRLYWECSG